MLGNWSIVLNNFTLIVFGNTPWVPLDHFVDELELVLGLFDELFDLTATETLLDDFPVLLFLAYLQAMAREALDGLTVAFILGTAWISFRVLL